MIDVGLGRGRDWVGYWFAVASSAVGLQFCIDVGFV